MCVSSCSFLSFLETEHERGFVILDKSVIHYLPRCTFHLITFYLLLFCQTNFIRVTKVVSFSIKWLRLGSYLDLCSLWSQMYIATIVIKFVTTKPTVLSLKLVLTGHVFANSKTTNLSIPLSIFPLSFFFFHFETFSCFHTRDGMILLDWNSLITWWLIEWVNGHKDRFHREKYFFSVLLSQRCMICT